MKAHPSALPTIQNQGALFGEIISDLVSDGKPITEILTEILAFGPTSLREAVHVARFMQTENGVEYVRLVTANTRARWVSRDKCAVCSGPAHEYYPFGPHDQPSRF